MNLATDSCIDKIYDQAAEAITRQFITPQDFIEFLSEGVYWVHGLEKADSQYEVAEDSIYALTCCITYIGVPWCTKENISAVKEGLGKIMTGLGADGWRDMVEAVMMGSNYICMTNGSYEQPHALNILDSIAALSKVGKFLYQIEAKESE